MVSDKNIFLSSILYDLLSFFQTYFPKYLANPIFQCGNNISDSFFNTLHSGLLALVGYSSEVQSVTLMSRPVRTNISLAKSAQVTECVFRISFFVDSLQEFDRWKIWPAYSLASRQSIISASAKDKSIQLVGIPCWSATTRNSERVSESLSIVFTKFLNTGSWFLVLGSWFLVLGSWFLVLGSWFWSNTSYLIPHTSHP